MIDVCSNSIFTARPSRSVWPEVENSATAPLSRATLRSGMACAMLSMAFCRSSTREDEFATQPGCGRDPGIERLDPRQRVVELFDLNADARGRRPAEMPGYRARPC